MYSYFEAKQDCPYKTKWKLAIKTKDEIMPFVTKMELAGIMLSEVRQRKTDTRWLHSYVQDEEAKQMNKQNETKQTILKTEW